MLDDALAGADPTLRRAVATHWWYRAFAEREAAVRFDALTARLEATGALTEVVELCRRSGDDERRHALLCAETAARYDPDDPFATRALVTAEVAPTQLSERERVLYELVAFCCVTESINAGLLTATLRVATEPSIRTAVRAILTDEVQHARLGWAHLTAERAQGLGAWLPRQLPNMLRGSLSEEALTRQPRPDDDLAWPEHGHLSFADRLAAFERALLDIVLPGCASLGIDTVPAETWAREYGFGGESEAS